MKQGTMAQLNYYLTAYVMRGNSGLELRIVRGNGEKVIMITMNEEEADKLADLIGEW